MIDEIGSSQYERILKTLNLTNRELSVIRAMSGSDAWNMSEQYADGHRFDCNIQLQSEPELLLLLINWRNAQNTSARIEQRAGVPDYDFALFLKGSLFRRSFLRERISHN